MKRASIPAVLWLLVSLAPTAEMGGAEIIRKVSDLINPETSHARVRMTITTSSGKTRAFVYETWSKNRGEKTLIRYLEPGRARGQATLLLNNADDIWMFFPRTRRVRKLATHAKKQKMEGSDFSYEDMGGGDAFLDDYAARRLEDESLEGQECFAIELTGRPERDASYSRLEMWVRQKDFVPLRIDYYSEKDPGRQEKQLLLSDIRVIDGIPTAMVMKMANRDDGTSTEMTFLEAEFNLDLDDGLFTERALQK